MGVILGIFAIGFLTLMLFTSEGRKIIGGIFGIFLVGVIVIGLFFGCVALIAQ